ncbi:MAG: Dam family site-specific DNA-(adenine-N6)-methyltransferase [Prevotella sp.]|nr:Dam family site-specific DNA-(adenine-N6)-methyltransferase [Prevotella sp.]MCM1074441.1 Dam family site-specific DNA-(adenine-N6)-methyltransferase [Ruminococcus sp.]
MVTTASIYQQVLNFEGLDEIQPFEKVRSPLNYIGGKFKLLPQILRYFPTSIDTFVDLFCGGCNVGVNVKAKFTVFNDNLVYLIDLYRYLKESTTYEVLDHIRNRIREFELTLTNKDGYLKLRNLYNTTRCPLDLFVLVAYSFNHQIRFNSMHQFNNPFGKDRSSFNPTMEKNLIAFIERLHQISCEFISGNFDVFDFSRLNPNDFVYCDPPYLISTGTYNDGKRGFTGWGAKEEYQLLSILDSLNYHNVRFALSNVLSHKGKQNDILIDWARKNAYNIVHLDMNYANSNYHTSDRRQNSTDEVLIINYDTKCAI